MNAPEQLLLLMEGLIWGALGMSSGRRAAWAGDALLRFDLADQMYSITGVEGVSGGKAVFIEKIYKKQQLKRLFLRKKSQLLKKIQ